MYAIYLKQIIIFTSITSPKFKVLVFIVFLNNNVLLTEL